MRGRAAASHPVSKGLSARVDHTHLEEAQQTRGTRTQERTAVRNPAASLL